MKKFVFLLLVGCGTDMAGLVAPPDSGIDVEIVGRGRPPISDADAVEMVDVVPVVDSGAGGVMGSGGMVGGGGAGGAIGAGGAVGTGGAACTISTCDLVSRNGHDYVFGIEATTQRVARAWCQQRGLDLVVVNDGAENDWLGVQALARSVTCRWIGVSDAVIEGKWVWINGSNLSFSAWLLGRPNNNASGDGEDCASLIPGTPGVSITGWDDMRCDAVDTTGFCFPLCETP